PEGLPPLACTVTGLVMADRRARMMLAGELDGDGGLGTETMGLPDLIVTESVRSFLTSATRTDDAAERAPAVIGLIAGSWTEEIAARVPDGTCVYVLQHADRSDAKHAACVVETLRA